MNSQHPLKEYNKVIELINNNKKKLNGRANRSKIEKSFISFLGITDKTVKKELAKAVNIHIDNGFSVEESVFAISHIILKKNGLISEESLLNPKKNIDLFIKNWFYQIENQKVNFSYFFGSFESDYFLYEKEVIISTNKSDADEALVDLQNKEE